MWKSIASRVCITNTKPYTPKLWYCLQNNPVCASSSSSKVIGIHKSLNYGIIVSPLRPDLLSYSTTRNSNFVPVQNNQRRLFCTYNNLYPRELLDSERSEILDSLEGLSFDDEKKAFSIVAKGFKDTDDNLNLLLNIKFFFQLWSFPPPDIPEQLLLRYFRWLFARDDFVVPRSKILVDIIQRYPDGWFYRNSTRRNLLKLVYRSGIKQKGVVTTFVLNHLLRSCKLDSQYVLGIFRGFEELGCEPDIHSYYIVLNKLLVQHSQPDCGDPSEIEFLQKTIDCGIFHKPGSDILIPELIENYCYTKKPQLAYTFYNSVKDRVPVKSVQYLVYCLSKHDDTLCLAMDILSRMPCEIRSNSNNASAALFSPVIKRLCSKGDIEAAKKLLMEMIAKGPPPGVRVFFIIINAIVNQVGDLEEALEMVKLMHSRGLQPNTKTYLLIKNGYKKRGMMVKAREVVSMARQNRILPHPLLIKCVGVVEAREFEGVNKEWFKRYGSGGITL